MDNQTNAVPAQNNTKFCKHCGEKIAKEAVICPLCGCQVEQIQNDQAAQPIVINNTNNNTSAASATAVANNSVGRMYGKPKNKTVALLLCILLGYLGAHKFYEGKVGMGILYLFTGGLFIVGIIIDIIALLGKPNPYYV